jgi:ubiquinone/menaquinone biosynthesis C-methylase UbiE
MKLRKLREMSNYINIAEYDKHEEKHAYFIDMMLEMISIFRENRVDDSTPCRILELGAGTGIFTKRLAKIRNIQLVAVELDQECFHVLQENCQDYPSIELVNENSCTYYSKKKFNYIFSSFSDHHIKSKDKHSYLQNIKRNLQPDGLFIVGDEFLPPHNPNDQAAWEAALCTYHNHIITIAQQQGETILADLEREALRSGLGQIGDFKISCCQYEDFLLTNGFTFICKKIGPLNQDDVGGVYVYQCALNHKQNFYY